MRSFIWKAQKLKNHDLSQNSMTVFPLSRILTKSFIDDLFEPKAVEIGAIKRRRRGMISELSSFSSEIRRN
jgi:hypothetical protein